MSNNTTVKVTKKLKFNTVLDLIDFAEEQGYEFPEAVSADSLRDFVNGEITNIANKAAAAQKRAAEKRAENDVLRDKVEAVITDVPQTVHDCEGDYQGRL